VRVAEMQKRNGCVLWTHISGGKGKQENVHGKTRNGRRKKGSKADKPANRGMRP